MTVIRSLACAAMLLFSSNAFAEDSTPTLLPNTLSLPVLDGAEIPSDCMYPSTISDTGRFELACVTMPSGEESGDIGAQYIDMLGERGWRQGTYLNGGFTAVHPADGGCEQVLNIFPSTFPPAERNASTMVIWFAMEREQRCPAPQTSP